jgi:hypothetical protein
LGESASITSKLSLPILCGLSVLRFRFFWLAGKS